MSNNFSRFSKLIKNTSLKLKNNLKKNFYIFRPSLKTYSNIFQKINFVSYNFKSKLFYLRYKLKPSIKYKYKEILNNFDSAKKRIKENISTKIHQNKYFVEIFNFIVKTKNFIITNFVKLSNFLKIISFGKIDLIYILKKLVNYKNYLFLISKTLNITINIIKKIFRFFFKKDFSDYFVPKTVSSLLFVIQPNSINKVNRFLKLPRQVQKTYYFGSKVSNIFSKFRKKDKGFFKSVIFSGNEKKFDIRKLNPFYSIYFIKQGSKNFFIKIIIYLMLFGLCYNLIKYYMFRLFDRKKDKQLKNAFLEIAELKKKNEELMRLNTQIIEKFVKNN